MLCHLPFLGYHFSFFTSKHGHCFVHSIGSTSPLLLYYNVNISVRNLNILNYRCTGKFKEQDGIEHILKVIQKDHKFTYSINEEKDSIIIE